jgi:tetratricopeptide (TPR) repeat protein
MACTGVNPFEMQKVGDNAEALKAYENDLSLEIKELPEEELNPISDECKELLEEYADAIKSFSKLLNKIEKNPEDINLLIARGEEEENLYSYSSKPLTFQCSTNPNFKKQVEILNGKRDKLISN